MCAADTVYARRLLESSLPTVFVTEQLSERGRDVLGGSLLRCTLQERKLKSSAVTVLRESNHEAIYATRQVLAPQLHYVDTRSTSLQP